MFSYIWNESSVNEATECKVHGKWNAMGVSIDTRKLKWEEIFIACRGKSIDGHNYVKEAFFKGASAAIVEYVPEDLSENELSRVVLVKDSIKALKDLAKFNRARTNAKIIAITGSVGKTSTKEAMSSALLGVGNTYSSPGNYNNDLGLSISMASMPIETQYAVYELGMSNPGELQKLSEILKPDVAVITNIAAVHISNFKSISDIARAKAEIFLGLQEQGAVFLNGDNEHFELLKSLAERKGIKKIYTFGLSEKNASYMICCKRENDFTLIDSFILGEKIGYKISAYGNHHATNTVAVLGVVKYLGLDLARACEALESFNNVKGRGKILKICINNKRIMLIDDSYNASPESMKAALRAISEIRSDDNKRVVAILADMYELGNIAVDSHKGLANDLAKSKVDKVITVGSLMKNLFDIIPDSVKLKHFENYTEAMHGINEHIEDKDCVLIKGSFGTKIHKLVDYLEESQ